MSRDYCIYPQLLMMATQVAVPISKDDRAQSGYRWFQQLNQYPGSWQMKPLFDDASFRRYFRLASGKKTLVLLDSPTDTEPLDTFLSVGTNWRQQGICVPEILACDLQQGFALLEDLGDKHLYGIDKIHPIDYYMCAIDQLVCIQRLKADNLPDFNQTFILKELSLLHEWTLVWLDLPFSTYDRRNLDRLFQWLAQRISQQPYCVMHRDYHCRNLMVQNDRLVAIDFQGAMNGPYSYDLASLLADAYRDLNKSRINQLQHYYLDQCDFDREHEDFIHDFMCIKLQRHIKVLGLFCRLCMRDNKARYLRFIPRVCHHINSASGYFLARETPCNQALKTITEICQSAKNKAKGYEQEQ